MGDTAAKGDNAAISNFSKFKANVSPAREGHDPRRNYSDQGFESWLSRTPRRSRIGRTADIKEHDAGNIPQ
tara:strand:+ start:10518 stop:10730 length:213 start_codon:yes stop_codon:yes gene_type:complete